MRELLFVMNALYFIHNKNDLRLQVVFVMSALRIFPGRHQPSIVRMKLLNYRVRNGNGWDQLIINTDYSESTHVLSKLNRRSTLLNKLSFLIQDTYRFLLGKPKVKPSIY